MTMYYLYALCVAACVLVALVGMTSGGSGANEALRQRLERRAASRTGAPAPGAVVPRAVEPQQDDSTPGRVAA